jgi:hypothetical protein
LVEARVRSLRRLEHAKQYGADIGRVVTSTPLGAEGGPILCADHRPVIIYPQSVADELTALFSAMNTRLSFVAILVARTNATLVMQLERIVREAKNPHRRVFHDPIQAHAFLEPHLTSAESVRMQAFLDEFRSERLRP